MSVSVVNSLSIETFNNFGLGKKLIPSIMLNSYDPNQPNKPEEHQPQQQQQLWDQGISMDDGQLASFSIRLDGGPRSWF